MLQRRWLLSDTAGNWRQIDGAIELSRYSVIFFFSLLALPLGRSLRNTREVRMRKRCTTRVIARSTLTTKKDEYRQV